MNCDTVDSILDDHRSARLRPGERQDLAAHLAACVRCAGASAAHDALTGEKPADPAPELFARVLGRVATARAHSQARHRDWRIGAAAVAVVALVAVVVGYSFDGGVFDGGVITRRNALTDAIIERVFGAADGGSPEREGVAVPAAPRFVAGRDYDVLAGVLPLAAGAEGVAVTELFMWGCDPCYALEPELVRWSAAASGRVALTRVPVTWNPEAALHARAFYTAEALGKLDAMHAAFYDEIHVRGNPLASRAALAELFARFGVDGATFDAAFDSGDVDARVQRAVALSREYGIGAVPALVIGGRYVTSPNMAGPRVLAVVDQLVADQTRAQSAAER
jgi:thiol:disulfide interchange protein DsbA